MKTQTMSMTRTIGCTKMENVKCPNLCLNGKEIYHQNEEIALFEFKNCNFCKGKGTVSQIEAKKILLKLKD